MARASRLAAVLPGTIATPILMAEREVYIMPGGWVFLGLGLLFVCAGILILTKHIRVVRRGVRTSGVVVEFARPSTFSSSYPVVEFKDVAGEQRREELPSTDGACIGKSINIIYDPRDPSQVLHASSFGLWIAPSILSLLGLFSVVVGVLSLLGMIELTSH